MKPDSFSQQTKKEILRNTNLSVPSWEAELAAMCFCLGYRIENGCIVTSTRNEDIAKRIQKAGAATLREARLSVKKARGGALHVVEITSDDDAWLLRYADPDEIDLVFSDQTELRRAMIRGAFLAHGYVAEPESAYRVELFCREDIFYKPLMLLLHAENIRPMLSARANDHVLYFKEFESVADFLTLVGASDAMIRIEDIRINRDFSAKMHRMVNCDDWNLSRQADASAARTEALRILLSSPKAASLPNELLQAAKVHIDNPGLSLKELGELMEPPISKSGMNHRLKKLMEYLE